MNYNVEANHKCYAYAQVSNNLPPCGPFILGVPHVKPLLLQGTASPTTPMATNAPISPSPTGTITSAPTPVGIASYTKIGEGAVSLYLLNMKDCFCVILTI